MHLTSFGLQRHLTTDIIPGFVEDILLTAVMEHAELDLKTKVAVVKAVNKVGDFFVVMFD